MAAFMKKNKMDKTAVYKALREGNADELKDVFVICATKCLGDTGNIELYAGRLLKFVTDYNWWLGGKGIERTNDYYVSSVLSVLNLVNASQEYVSKLVYLYSTEESLYNERNNDRKKMLFKSMINIIEQKREDVSYRNNAIGVNHFAGVWERLINHVFGESDIEKYFPKAKWHILKNGKFIQSSSLEPDTIMKYDGKIYILDAKYYQYGVTWAYGDLPNTSSIQKQITYAKHVDNMGEVDTEKIYNAFVMPFNCSTVNTENESSRDYILKFVAVGESGWDDYSDDTAIHNYHYILGILLDTRHIVTSFARHNLKEIENLANKIEDSLDEYKKAIALERK